MNANKSTYLIPIAIILAGIVLAVTIFVIRSGNPLEMEKGDISLVRPVNTGDHIIGSPEAAVVIVEYSDIDCEYCKSYQQVMAQLMAEYGADGEVAWVYRHFPLTTVNPDSATHAEAAECVASLGGEEMFWRFIDALQGAAPGESRFDPTQYGSVVSSLGVAPSDLEECLKSDKFAERVALDFDNAIEIGGAGTPYSVVLIKGSEPITISGYLPYDAMKEVIERSLEKVTTP